MPEEKPMVEALGYIGGQDEELGGYCEPLVIRVHGREHYVLHEMHTYRDPADEIKAKHRKVEFNRLEALVDAFKKVEERLGIDKSLPWAETDPRCGYGISEEEWEKARASWVKSNFY